MNLRKLCLISVAVLLIAQLGLAADRNMGLQQAAKAVSTGKPQLVQPTASAGTHARSTAVFSGRRASVAQRHNANVVTGEPWFCDFTNGSYVMTCPKGVQTAYHTNFAAANGGRGMTIAIVDFFFYLDVGSAIAQYSSDMHLPQMDCVGSDPCLYQEDFSNGNECELCDGWEVETMLDIESVHAMAPYANIVYIGGDPFADGSVEELFAQAVGNATSNSWTFNGGEFPYWEAYLGQGPPTLFASGDYNYFPYSGISYPCTSPQAVCVGGTTLNLNPSNLTRASEVAWSYNPNYGWGTGGGCSGVFAQPAFQNQGAPVNSNGVCGGLRSAPDIGALADPLTGFATYIGGFYAPYYYQVGGTSLATPLMAGLIADIDAARASFGKPPLAWWVNNELYPAAVYNYPYYFYDITSGYNGYNAGPGFDLLTGLGVPNGGNLASRFFGIP